MRSRALSASSVPSGAAYTSITYGSEMRRCSFATECAASDFAVASSSSSPASANVRVQLPSARRHALEPSSVKLPVTTQ